MIWSLKSAGDVDIVLLSVRKANLLAARRSGNCEAALDEKQYSEAPCEGPYLFPPLLRRGWECGNR
jgi:hypothetical protein